MQKMASLEFSDDEIQRQLSALGYSNIPGNRLNQFKKDLYKLIEHDHSFSGSSSWFTGVSSPSSNSDFSESDKNKASQGSSFQPAASLSRFQPHRKVDPPQQKNDQSSTFQDFTKYKCNDESHHRLGHSINRDIGHTAVPRSRVDYVQWSDVDTTQSQWTENGASTATSGRLRDEADDDTASSEVTPSESDLDFSTVPGPSEKHTGRIIRKRKVLRKEVDGTPRVYDESLIEDAAGQYRMHDVSVDDSDPRLARYTERDELPPRPHSARPIWKKDVDFQTFIGPDQPPSYIRPNTSHPHTRNIKKTDPVNRYHQYKDFWTSVKAPGEKSHKSLRWEVKAQMMYREEPAPKPQKTYVPNSYVVPTSKKRSALRWEVRHAMERGLPVPTAFDVY